MWYIRWIDWLGSSSLSLFCIITNTNFVLIWYTELPRLLWHHVCHKDCGKVISKWPWFGFSKNMVLTLSLTLHSSVHTYNILNRYSKDKCNTIPVYLYYSAEFYVFHNTEFQVEVFLCFMCAIWFTLNIIQWWIFLDSVCIISWLIGSINYSPIIIWLHNLISTIYLNILLLVLTFSVPFYS